MICCYLSYKYPGTRLPYYPNCYDGNFSKYIDILIEVGIWICLLKSLFAFATKYASFKKTCWLCLQTTSELVNRLNYLVSSTILMEHKIYVKGQYNLKDRNVTHTDNLDKLVNHIKQCCTQIVQEINELWLRMPYI